MKTRASHPLFDTLIAENPLVRNDADLCKVLGVEAPLMSKMRHRRLPISDRVRVAVMRKFRWSLKRLDEVVPPEAPTDGEAASH